MDVVVTHPGFYTGMFPETDLQLGLPLSWETWPEVWEVMYERGLYEVIKNAYDQHNLLFFPIPSENVSFVTKFPVSKVDDFKGKKIRAIGIMGKYAQALGASVVVIPGEELYMALKLGTVDGAIYGPSALQDMKIAEVVNYWILPNICLNNMSLVFSKKSLNKLPEDIRNMVVNSSRYFVGDSGMEHASYSMKSYYVSLKNHQIKSLTLPEQEVIKMRNKRRPLWDELAAKSPNMQKGISIIKQLMKDLNKAVD